jgi:indole-3-glycerol phosphate synthase
MQTVLEKIAVKVQAALDHRKSLCSEEKLRKLCESARRPHDVTQIFSSERIQAIAEIKFASPSEGIFGQTLDAVSVARSYLKQGAGALSILTEKDHFQGNFEYVTQVRKEFPQARILMKDFILEPYQMLEARHIGADAILLIVSLLGIKKVEEYLSFAKTLGLSALVEVHDEEELSRALATGAKWVGINNRNLKTLAVSLDTSLRMIGELSAEELKSITLISESGIKEASEVQTLAKAGFKGVLVGSSLMKQKDPGLALSELMRGSHVS